MRFRLIHLIASLVLLAGCVEGGSEVFVVSQATTAHAAPSELLIEITEDAATVRAHGVTLESLLEEISLQSRRSTDSQALAGIAFADGREAPGTLEAEMDVGTLGAVIAGDDVTARLEATQALAYVGGGEAAAELADVVLGDSSPEVRRVAIYALSEVGGDLRVHILEQALSDPDNQVRAAAIDAFADIGGDESALALAFVLNDEDRLLRAEAVDALVAIGGETAMIILEQALADQDSAIRDVAAEYLAELSP